MNEINKNWKIVQSLKQDMDEYERIQVDVAFKKVGNRIDKQTRKTHILYWGMRIAAMLAVPLLLGTSYCTYLYIERLIQDKNVPMLESYSAPGQVSRITLSDGSIVWLNAGSKLVYPVQFNGKERNVQLTGEGYFEVHADANSPFYVSASDGIKVMAYGTKFNVDAYPEENKIKMTLVEGKVDVRKEDKRLMKLSPGYQAVYNKEGKNLSSLKVNSEVITGWTIGKMMFRDATITEVIKHLSRRYNVDISLHCDNPDKYKFRATFTDESITQVLDYLRLAAPLSWSFSKAEQHSDFSFSRQKIDLWLK